MASRPYTLPDGYYLRNFETLIDEVEELYDDLLDESERALISAFRSADERARRLYVRFLTRKGPLFRKDLIAYSDIPDVDAAILELSEANMLTVGGLYDIETALCLLRVPELVELFRTPAGRKPERIAWIVEHHDEATVRAAVDKHMAILEPQGMDVVEKLRLLFFGNSYQDLSEFIVTELGNVTYESYPIDHSTRPFDTRAAIDAVRLVNEVSAALHEASADHDSEAVLELARRTRSAVFPPAVAHRGDKLANAVARQLEREGLPEDAYELYSNSALPPSRERRARMDEKAGRHLRAAALIASARESPLTEDEHDFALSFGNRMWKRHGSPYEEALQSDLGNAERRITLAYDDSESVEQAALRRLLCGGDSGWWCENLLINGLFGLFFWDIIFEPLQGVFFNRFQRGPNDLLRPSFRERRLERIQDRLRQIADGRLGRDHVVRLFEEKRGVANWFVDWRRLERTMVEIALGRIPSDHLVGMFDRITRDVAENRAGFPDLALFPRDGGYRFVEVKGPGDQIQKNQARWLRHFAATGVPCEVLWVSREST